MKIVHVIDSAGFYGAESMLVSLALEQKKMGFSPVICGIANPGQEEPSVVITARKLGLFSVSLFLYGSVFNQGKMIFNYAESVSANVIHSHGYRPGILLGILPAHKKIAKMRTLHGWTHTKIFSKLYLYNLIDALLLWRQDAVVVVSNKMKENSLMKFLSNSMVSTIPNGISATGMKNLKIDELNDEKFRRLNKECYLIGAVGRLSAEKKQTDMIKAVSLLRDRGYQVAIVIIGEGPKRIALEKLASDLKIAEFVHLPGYLANAASYLNFFDVLCMSSTTEGLPISILEAMSQEVPVVSTKVGDIPALLGQGRGGLVNPGDVLGIANTIEALINDPNISKSMIRSAHQYFLKYHSSVAMAENYSVIYKSIVF